MPERRRTEPWKIAIGYAAFSLLAFFFFFYVTFPYGALRERLQTEAAAQGYQLEMRGMGPGFFGVTARGVSLLRRPTPGDNARLEPLQVDSIAFRPSLLPLGLAFRASLMDGKITGSVGGLGELDLDLEASDLDLSAGNMKAFSGLDLSGTLNGRLTLDVPRVTPAGAGQRAGAEPDFAQATGSLVLDGEDVVLNGGTVTVPMYGQPTPVDLPKITLGQLNARVAFEKGQGKVEALEAQSTDVDVKGSGGVKLARRLELSELNVELRFKPDPQFQKRLGMIGAGMSMLQVDRQDPQYRMARLTGFLGRPTFR